MRHPSATQLVDDEHDRAPRTTASATDAQRALEFLLVTEGRAIAEGRGDDADALARTHGAIDFEHITTAMRRAGVLAD